MNILQSIINNFKVISANAKTEKSKMKIVAREIYIDDLSQELKLLSEDKTEFDFIGITSKSFDCIYFSKSNLNFNIEFEAVEKEQLSYLDKLKEFSLKNNLKFEIETNNKIPFLSIKTNSNSSETINLAKIIQKEIFGNNDDTKYEIVP